MTTLDLSERKNVLAVQAALAGDSDSLWDAEPDQIILVSDLIAHFAERTDDETGETTAGPMLTLIGPDSVWHTGSQYAFRCLQSIAYLTGRPPWNPPIAVYARRKRSRNKREYQTLILAE